MKSNSIFLNFLIPLFSSKSNRESGYGRYDISIIPKDVHKVGYVIEFKAIEEEDVETADSAVESALKQIEDKQYETELMERGVSNIKKWPLYSVVKMFLSKKKRFDKEQKNK